MAMRKKVKEGEGVWEEGMDGVEEGVMVEM